jgi:FAD-dependent urate hydroxylase
VRGDAVAIVGAGPYGLSIAAHLAARKVPHRIFGQPMSFWSQIADAGGERFLKSYCFGTNISAPKPGSTFADYSRPRGLETFEPCSMRDFSAYGLWFQEKNVPWLEPFEVERITKTSNDFALLLSNGQSVFVPHVIIASGLSCFSHNPPELASLPDALAIHTSKIASFMPFKGRDVAVVGAGQSALEAAALLAEAGSHPRLLVRENAILWNKRVLQKRTAWQRMRSPISGLGTGPKAWALTNVPGAMQYTPEKWRARFVKHHLPAEGAWWLRARVEGRMPIDFGTRILAARERDGRVELRVNGAANGPDRVLTVDCVVAGSGYDLDIKFLHYIAPSLRAAVACYAGAPRLNGRFESSVRGLRFVGPTSAMSFGPLFRFVVGAEYTARIVAADLASQISSAA